MRLIDADALEKRAVLVYSSFGDESEAILLDDVVLAPTIEAVPVVRGEWIESHTYYDTDGEFVQAVYCSVCLKCEDREMAFCPNCGAKMDGKAV